MADCSAPAETDDLHRRWLPREIFADIGIADVVDAAPTTAAAVEHAAAHLTGGKREDGPPPPPPWILSYPAQPQVCGLEAMACVPYAYGACPPPPPPCPWPLVYLPLQWQVATYGTAAFLGGPRYNYQAPPPPPAAAAKRRMGGVGTGVFLPRAGAGHQRMQHKAAAAMATASPAPARDGRLPEKKKKQQQQQQQEHQRKEEDEQKPQQEDHEAAAEVLLALPQEWTY